MRKIKRQYDVPKRPWDKTRIEEERKLSEYYGLKNKKSLWRAGTTLRKKRDIARRLLAMESDERTKREKELLDSLERIGIKAGSLDEVLSLNLETFLERRLQTIVFRKGLANTMKQARQFITHGHIKIRGGKISAPSYTVTKEEEPYIELNKEIIIDQKQNLKGVRPGEEGIGTEEKPKDRKSLEEEFLESTKGLEESVKDIQKAQKEEKARKEDKEAKAGKEGAEEK